MQFSRPNNRGLYGTVMFALLLTSLALFTFHSGQGLAQTDQASAPNTTTDYQASYAQSLYITPSLNEKTRDDVNTSFEVNVTIEDVSDLFGFDFNLTWNNTLITLRSVRFEASLDQLWGHDQWFVAANQTGLGWYKLAAVSVSTGFSGVNAMVLATLEFRVENVPAGETPIHFAVVKLSDSNYTPISIGEIRDATYRMLPKTMLGLFPSLIERTAAEIGTYFNASITIENVTDLFGFDMNITWDNTLITYHTCYSTNTLDAVWGSGNWQLLKSESGTGWYKIVAVSTKNGFTKDPGIQTLFILEFRVEEPHTNTAKQTPIHFDTHKLSNSQYSAITHTTEDGTYRVTGETPILTMNPTSKTCRIYGETFTIGTNMSDAFDVTDFEFEIHYNTTLLDYVSVTWNAWGQGTITVDEAGGNITASNSGSPISGMQTLITVEFKAAYYHVWKSAPSWTNNLTDTIFFQWANISYPSGPDLRYERGGSSQINVGPDFAYTFSPIQGDVDNDGIVGLFDLRTVAFYFGSKQGDPNWNDASKYDLTGDGTIDIISLRTIAANYGYTYNP